MDRTSTDITIDAIDHAMMERCIALAMRAMDHGEYPYAAVISRNGEVVCELINSARHDHDASHHAEVVAMSEALRRLNRVSSKTSPFMQMRSLARCAVTLCAKHASAVSCLACRRRSLVESHAGTFLPIQSCQISCLKSSRRHPRLCLASCVSRSSSAIASRAPLAWEVIRARNIFGGPLPAEALTRALPQPSRGFRQQFMSFLRRRLFDYFGRK